MWCEFREWYHIHEQAKNLHFVACPYCHTPAQRETAFFCSHCGASLKTEPTMTTEPELYTTEPLPVELPSEILRRQLQERRQTRQLGAQQDISELPTRKFRTVRLERIV